MSFTCLTFILKNPSKFRGVTFLISPMETFMYLCIYILNSLLWNMKHKVKLVLSPCFLFLFFENNFHFQIFKIKKHVYFELLSSIFKIWKHWKPDWGISPNTLSATIGETKSDQNQNKISTQIRIISYSRHINHPCYHTCEAITQDVFFIPMKKSLDRS